MINTKRQFTTSEMTVIGLEKRVHGGFVFVMEDSLGVVRFGVGITFTGATYRVFNMERDEDIQTAIGRKVKVFFGTNGIPKTINGVIF